MSKNPYKNTFTTETAHYYAGSGRETPKTRKISAAVTVLLILAVSLIPTPRADTLSSTAKDKMPAFLSEVMGLDLTRYNVTNEEYGFSYPSYYGGNVKEENIVLDLASSDGNMHVRGMFVNGFIYGIFLYPPTNGSLTYAQRPSTNALDESRNMLQRYKTFAENYGFDTSHIDPALTMVSSATRASSSSASLYMFNNMTGFVPSVTVAGNTKQETTETGIKWIYTDRGVDMPSKCLAIEFGGNELLFADTWNLFSVGCFSVISEDEAKSIGWDAAKNFNLTLISENGTLFSVKPELSNMYSVSLSMIPGQIYNRDPEDHFVSGGNATRDPLALYPQWHMVFYFNKSIGGVVGIQVGVWGDTKEIAYISGYGYLGGSGGNQTTPTTPTTPSPSLEPTPNSNSEPFPTTLVIASIVLVAVIGIGLLVYFKKRQRGSVDNG